MSLSANSFFFVFGFSVLYCVLLKNKRHNILFIGKPENLINGKISILQF